MGLQKVAFNFMVERGGKLAKSLLCTKPVTKPINIKGLKYYPKQNYHQFQSNISKSETYQKIRNGIISYAPKVKHEELIKVYDDFVKSNSDLKVVEQLFVAVENQFKGLPQKELIKRYNKIFKNINTLRLNNPEDYLYMVKGGFFDLIEQGKVPLENLRTNFKNARLSRSLLEDLKKVANKEEYIPNYSHMNTKEIAKIVRNGDVYIKNEKLYTRNNGIEIELKISKEKFEELFPPVLRHISQQGNIGNCWFVSRLNNLMSTESGRSGIYSLFRQSGDDIYIKFPKCDKEILFPNGHILTSTSGKQIKAVTGLSMVEQAYAVHRTGRYLNGNVTNIESFRNVDNLMSNLQADSYKAMIHDEAKNKDVLDLISSEYTYNISSYGNILGGFRRFVNKYLLNKNLFDRYTSKINLEKIIDSQANSNSLKINIAFKKGESDLIDLYNIVPNHQLMLSAVENNRYWVTNPWFNWIEKGVDRSTFYRHLIEAQVPMQW